MRPQKGSEDLLKGMKLIKQQALSLSTGCPKKVPIKTLQF